MDKKDLTIIRQQFAQCVFSHKVQEKAVERIEKIVTKIKWMNVWLLGFVLIAIILQLKFQQISLLGDFGIAITIFEILFLYLQEEFSFEKKATEHKRAALKYLELRDKYKNFIVDIMNGAEEKKIILKRDLLQEQYQIISDLAPQTEYSDYTKAQLSLFGKTNTDEEFTWSDDEIDLFLPNELKLLEKI